MTIKTFCDGPDCEVIVVGNDPDWWIAQQACEVFHFHSIGCLAVWGSGAIAAQVAADEIERMEGSDVLTADTRSHQSAAGACSHPWHLRGPDLRGGDCPRCGSFVVTEPVPGT